RTTGQDRADLSGPGSAHPCLSRRGCPWARTASGPRLGAAGPGTTARTTGQDRADLSGPGSAHPCLSRRGCPWARTAPQ
ncbi:hypothetical protein, partial [Streptomyces sp. NPDC004008]